MEELVKLLIAKEKTISVMESCTGGGITNAITNIPNASKVIKFSAVTYANEFKIKLGVSQELIKQKTVYSMDVAVSMAVSISRYANSSFGVGVTGKLKKADENNPYGEDDVVYLAIYDRDNSRYDKILWYGVTIHLEENIREKNKQKIIDTFIEKMKDILK